MVKVPETLEQEGLPSVVSIDPPLCVDRDDAIAVFEKPEGGYVVDVCVPDVPALVEPDSAVDKRARDLGLTRYGGPFIKTPMLYEGIIGKLSLSPQWYRPMVWIRIALNAALDVVGLRIKRLNGKTQAKLSYYEADQILDDRAHELYPKLLALWALAQKLHAKRCAHTGAVFDLERGWYTSEEGVLQALSVKDSHRSKLIVMEMMILANAALARYCRGCKLPILYRNHRLKDVESGFRAHLLKELSETRALGAKEALHRLKTLSAHIGPATLGVEPEGHWGLDLKEYAWFTSPLRRYADIVNLRAVLDSYAAPDLAGLGERLSAVHVEERQRKSSFHLENIRRTIVRHINEGNVRSLAGYDLLTLLKACADEEYLATDALLDDVRRRMAAGVLTERETEAMFTHGREIFPEAMVEEVVAWLWGDRRRVMAFIADAVTHGRISGIPRRQDGTYALAIAFAQLAEQFRLRLPPEAEQLLAEDEALFTPVSAVDVAERNALRTEAAAYLNARGDLLEYAAKRSAQVKFVPLSHTGPAHKPSFVVEAVWTLGKTSIKRQGTGSNIKGAAREAAYLVLIELGLITGRDRSDTEGVDTGALARSSTAEFPGVEENEDGSTDDRHTS